jgi:Tol biopolymer transport system component
LNGEKSQQGGFTMNRKKEIIPIITIFLATLIFTASGFQNSSDHKVLFEKAKYTMETKGDLNGAIKLFEEIIQKYPDEREYAAKSQLYIGICYEKLGQKEAQKAYQRVIKEFADQSEVAAEARARLASLGSAASEIEGLIFRKIQFPDQEKRTHLALLSPDATKMLYVHFQDKKPRSSLYVMDLSSGQVKSLVEGVEAGGDNFFEWSPDGKKIAYRHGQGEIRVINSDGGESEVLWSFTGPKVTASPVDWSRDGLSILCYVLNEVNWMLQVAILPSSGGKPRFIMKGSLMSFAGGAAQFSPDGKYIVDQRTKEGNTDLYIWNVDGNQEIRLTDHPAKDDYPFWSPDGKYIVFTSDRAKTKDLWAIPMQGARPGGDPVLLKRNLGKNTRLTGYTASGVLTMLVVSEGGGSDLFVLPVDPFTGEARGQLRPFAKYPTNHSFLRWSPEGERVSYTSRKGEIGWPRIFVSSGSEKQDKEITAQNFYVINVEWSRDGNSLIFPGIPGFELKDRPGIFRVSLNDSKIEPLYLGDESIQTGFIGAFVNLQWLPQAETFIFEKLLERIKGNTYRKEIYRMDKEGKNIQLVTDKISTDVWIWPSPNSRYVAYQEGQDLKLWSLDKDAFLVTLSQFPEGKPVEGPAWSPDGCCVAFKDKNQLKVFSPAENTSRVLVGADENSEIGGVAWHGGFAWSPDGKTIAYVLQDRSTSAVAHYELWTVPAEGGKPQKRADAPESYPVLGELTWHSSGRMIAVTGETAEAKSRLYEHWALENFLPEEKK